MNYTGDMTKKKNNRVMNAPRGAYNSLLSNISAYSRNTYPRSFCLDWVFTRRINAELVAPENIANKIVPCATLTSTGWVDGLTAAPVVSVGLHRGITLVILP